MGFTIEDLQRHPDGAMYTSPARICVTADGRLTDENDPEAVKLLVAEGGQIPLAEAAEYGLVIGGLPFARGGANDPPAWPTPVARGNTAAGADDSRPPAHTPTSTPPVTDGEAVVPPTPDARTDESPLTKPSRSRRAKIG